MLLFSCLAGTGHCLGFLNCMSLFLHFHFWKLFEVFFFFNGLPTQFLLSFEKTAGIPLQPKSLVTVIVKNCVCTSLLFSSLLFSSLLFSSLLFSSLLFSSLLFSSLAMTVIAMQFHWIEFYFIIYRNSSHGRVFQHKCPNEKNGQETEWHFVLSV